MECYSNDFDVSGRVQTTDPATVNEEVDRIFQELYGNSSTEMLDRAFYDLARLYRGDFPGYRPCDTAYHDIQHVLDVTLAMARLVDGYERSRVAGTEALGSDLFLLGVITALFHDCGYIREIGDTTAKNGAEYTLTHVSRGARFLRQYLPRIGMGGHAEVAAKLIHFTGYEVPVSKIEVPNLTFRLLGNLLGSADIIAQMADRCYLEKCHERLYPEFVAGGIAKKRLPDGKDQVVFASADDLLMKTPGFYQGANKRLESDLDRCYSYVEYHFGGQNLYLDELNKNIEFARKIIGDKDPREALKRKPPETLKPEED